MSNPEPTPCNHCEGKGYTAIRDCVGDIQYESTCEMCGGIGTVSTAPTPDRPKITPIAPRQ